MPDLTTPLMKALDLASPLVLAPLGGGPSTPELTAAVSNAGGLGTLAVAYSSPAQIDAAVARTRELTQRPFAMNLFTPMPPVEVTTSALAAALAATRPFRAELGLADPELRPPYHPEFDAQFAAVMRARPRVFSFVFGLLDEAYIRECRQNNVYTIGTATTPEEAAALEALGVDAVAAQGVEAGGHRGIFSTTADEPGIAALDLVRACCARVRLPVLAAGGLMTGADVHAALAAGAQAAMLGTAFLLCPEAGTSAPYRASLKDPHRGSTRLTRAFSGRLARGLENRFLQEMGARREAVLPWPAQNAFTRDLRNESTKRGLPAGLSLWAGTGVAGIREMGAGDLVRTLMAELAEARG